MKKRFLVMAALILLCVAVVSAQSADALSKMIEADQVTVGDVSYFLAVYLDAVPESASGADAVRALQNADICSDDVGAFDVLTYKTFAGLLMRTWNVKGGLMYSITKADRYALRELQAAGFISAGADPQAVVSGYDALAVLNDCMTQLGGK